MVRACLYSGIQFVTYEIAKDHLLSNTSHDTWTCVKDSGHISCAKDRLHLPWNLYISHCFADTCWVLDTKFTREQQCMQKIHIFFSLLNSWILRFWLCVCVWSMLDLYNVLPTASQCSWLHGVWIEFLNGLAMLWKWKVCDFSLASQYRLVSMKKWKNMVKILCHLSVFSTRHICSLFLER